MNKEEITLESLNAKVDKNFLLTNTKIDNNFVLTNNRIDGAVNTILIAMTGHFQEIKDQASVGLELKTDDMRIYNDRYNEAKDNDKVLGMRIDSLDLRVSELENA